MAEEVLEVELRSTRGKRRNRRLRAAGSIPAILYGHGSESMSLSVHRDQLDTAIRQGSQLVSLQGAVSQSALIREVQWDTFGLEVLHVDLIRVSADERIETEVELVLRGEAPGSHEGGIVQLLVHQVAIECPAGEIPEKLRLRVNELQLEQTLTAGDIELPERVKLLLSPDAVVVTCHAAAPSEEDEEEVEPASDGVEPEVIGQKKEEDASEA